MDNDNSYKLKNVVLIVYLLQAISFVFGITLIIGVIINYVKREDAIGTWLESHFNWQIKTFWISLIVAIIGGATIVFGIGFFILGINYIWIIYRIIKGAFRLLDEKEVI